MMIETIVYYVLPNVVLFGGLYFIAKAFEKAVWMAIVYYAED